MKTSWMLTTLLSAALAASCGDRPAEDPATLEGRETAPGAALSEDAAAPSAAPDTAGAPAEPSRTPPTAAVGEGSSGGRPVAGTPPGAAAPPVTAPSAREVTVPAGTALPLDLVTPLSSETAQVETPVRARLRQAVTVGGTTVFPAGAEFAGHVTDVERAGRVQGLSRLAFRFTTVEFEGGRHDVRTNPLSFQGEATRGEDAAKIGGGAVGGAIVGGILGGGDGAAKGAAIGGAAGTAVVLATRGREVTLPAGTNLAATLATPFTVRAPAR